MPRVRSVWELESSCLSFLFLRHQLPAAQVTRKLERPLAASSSRIPASATAAETVFCSTWQGSNKSNRAHSLRGSPTSGRNTKLWRRSPL
jgi:hypothetical protein